MSEKKPPRMEFWKVVGTKHINGVDAKIRIPTFGKWRNYKAGELVKSAFLDEIEKIAAKGVVPKKSIFAKRKTQKMDIGTRFLEFLKGKGKRKK